MTNIKIEKLNKIANTSLEDTTEYFKRYVAEMILSNLQLWRGGVNNSNLKEFFDAFDEGGSRNCEGDFSDDYLEHYSIHCIEIDKLILKDGQKIQNFLVEERVRIGFDLIIEEIQKEINLEAPKRIRTETYGSINDVFDKKTDFKMIKDYILKNNLYSYNGDGIFECYHIPEQDLEEYDYLDSGTDNYLFTLFITLHKYMDDNELTFLTFD